MNHFLSRNSLLRALGSATMLSALVSLGAARVHGDTPAASPATPDSDVAMAGMMVARDAKTCELRVPTAKEMRKLGKQMRKLAKAQALEAALRGESDRAKPPQVTTLPTAPW